MPPSPSDGLQGWDERALDAYYQLVHPTLPVLPGSRVQLRQQLLACPNSSLRNGLLSILGGLVQKQETPGGGPPVDRDYFRQPAIHGITQSYGQSTTGVVAIRLMTTVLIYVQSQDPLWLGAAVALTYELRRLVKPTHPTRSEAGPVDDETLAMTKRLYQVVVVLDHIHSVAHGVPVHIYEVDRDLCSPYPSGMQGPDATLAHMIRFAVLAASPTATLAEVEAFGSTIAPLWDTTPVLRALYYFAHIAIGRRSGADYGQIMQNAAALCFLLESPLVSVSPLVPNCVILLAMTVREATGREPTSVQEDVRRVQDYVRNDVAKHHPQLQYLIRPVCGVY
jgi:hypothetical protein